MTARFPFRSAAELLVADRAAAPAVAEACPLCAHDLGDHRDVIGGYSGRPRTFCRVCGRWCGTAAYHGERGI